MFQPSSKPSDADLMSAVVEGDENAFREIFHRHVYSIRRYLLLRVGPNDADDVVAATFAEAWRFRSSYRSDAGPLLPWLLGIATNQARRNWVAEKRWQAVANAELAQQRCGYSELPEIGDPALGLAVAQLPRAEREIVLLVAIGDMTAAMAARTLGISSTAARMRFLRARKRLEAFIRSKEQET